MSAKGWKCCGCGRVSPDGNKPCDCVTICAYSPTEKGSKVWDDCSLWNSDDDAKTIASLRTALSQEREAREKAERERDHVIRTSDAYNATEREARAIMGEAAAIERAETLEASLAEAKRLLKPFAHEAREDDGQDRSDWTHAPDNELLASFCDLTYGDFRAARDFLSQEPNHER